MRPRTPAHRRADRLAQQKKRGSKTSPVTEAENAKIVLAWEAGELTEGQASAALGRDRIGARLMRESFIGSGIALAAALQPDHECPRCGERFAHGKAHNCLT